MNTWKRRQLVAWIRTQEQSCIENEYTTSKRHCPAFEIMSILSLCTIVQHSRFHDFTKCQCVFAWPISESAAVILKSFCNESVESLPPSSGVNSGCGQGGRTSYAPHHYATLTTSIRESPRAWSNLSHHYRLSFAVCSLDLCLLAIAMRGKVACRFEGLICKGPRLVFCLICKGPLFVFVILFWKLSASSLHFTCSWRVAPPMATTQHIDHRTNTIPQGLYICRNATAPNMLHVLRPYSMYYERPIFIANIWWLYMYWAARARHYILGSARAQKAVTMINVLLPYYIIYSALNVFENIA